MKLAITKYISNHRTTQRILRFLKQTRFKNTDATYFQIGKQFLDATKKNHIQERANNVAFNFVMAIFPTVIFLFTLIPYIPIENLDKHIMEFIQPPVLPESLYESISETIFDIISVQRGGLLSFGFFLALYLSTNGMISLMGAFNRSYRSHDKRGFIKSRLIATLLTVLMAMIIFIAIVLLIIGEITLDFLTKHGLVFIEDYTIYLLFLLRFIVIFFVFQIGVSTIYYLAPSVKSRWHFFSTGSVLAALACVGVSFGFSFYINNFGAYNKLYGSIGALIAIMVWISMLSLILMLGFELNASIEKATGLNKALNRFLKNEKKS